MSQKEIFKKQIALKIKKNITDDKLMFETGTIAREVADATAEAGRSRSRGNRLVN